MARDIDEGNVDEITFDNSRIVNLDNHTISMWVKRSDSGDSFACFCYTGNLNTGVTLAQNGTTTGVLYRMNPASVRQDIIVSDFTELDTWVHLLARYDNVDIKLFKNGFEVGTEANTGTLDAAVGGIAGIGGLGGNRSLDSAVGEVGIWDVALNLGEIAALARGKSPDQIRRRSLREYYPMDEGRHPEPSLVPGGTLASLKGTYPVNGPPLVRKVSPIRHELFIGEVASASTFTQAVIIG